VRIKQGALAAECGVDVANKSAQVDQAEFKVDMEKDAN
jgi:hypothetical protein